MWILLHRFHRIYACRKNFVKLYKLFSPNGYEKIDKIIYKYFKDKYVRRSKSRVWIDETKDYLFIILSSTVAACVSVSEFASLVCFTVGITSSAVGINICAITSGIKKHNSIINKTKKKHNKIVLLGKGKLNTTEVLISKALIDTYIIHDKFISINNVLRKYHEMKKEIKNPETSAEYII